MGVTVGILDAYASAKDTIENRPAVTLLNKQHPKALLTVFATAFTREREVMLTGEFHGHVGTVLGTLRDAGHAVPRAHVRDLARGWVDEGWLVHDVDAEGRGFYYLTAASKDAIAWTSELARRRGVSATQVNNILDDIEAMAIGIDRDRDAALERCKRQIAEAAAELKRLEEDGEVLESTIDVFVEQFEDISRRMAAIPADFRTVAEEFLTSKREIQQQIMTGGGRAGEVISAAAQGLRAAEATPSWKAFQGVIDVLRDPVTVAALRENIRRIMTHDFAGMLHPLERASFADITAVFIGNVEAVLEGPRKISAAIDGALGRHVARHDDQVGLDEAIRAAREALWNFQGRSIAEGVIPHLGRGEWASALQRLHDPRSIPAPTPISELAEPDAEPLSAEEARRWGGPHPRAVREHINTALVGADAPLTVGDLWQVAPDDLRRSVELMCYLHVAHTREDTSYFDGASQVVETDAPDAETRSLAVPAIALTTEDIGERSIDG